jgi:hypothetical protein
MLQIYNDRVGGSSSLDKTADGSDGVGASICIRNKRRLNIDDKQGGFRHDGEG